MELRVYTEDLARVGQADNARSVVWTRRYYEPGEAEINLPLTQENLSLFQKGRIVGRKDRKEAAVIEDIEITENEEDAYITAKGRFLSSYLSRRITGSTTTYTGTYEATMRAAILACAPLPRLVMAEPEGYEETVKFQATRKNLQALLTRLAKASEIGYRVRPDFKNRQLVFETYRGQDRTAAGDRVMFSDEYGNITNITYRYSAQKYRNVAVIGGEGEGADRVIVTIDDGQTGLDRYELFVDAKDIRKEEGMTDAEYEALLLKRGEEKLKEAAVSESIECETDGNAGFSYLEDYDLGDIVQVKKKGWVLSMSARLTEIKECYENGALTIIPTIGIPLPETLDLED